jgi:glycosyltransferase involved in cell wall biosynthesis
VAGYLSIELKRAAEGGHIISLVSSLCSHWIGTILGECGIPSVWLIHEFRGFFSCRELAHVGASAKTLVFPCNLIKSGFVDGAHSHEEVRRLCEDAIVRPQGIWWREKGLPGPSLQSDALRTGFRDSHGIPHAAFVVLGCGTVDPRKGVDWFVMLAGHARASLSHQDIHFVWVGRIGEDEFGTRLSEDLARSGMLGGNLHFPGQLRCLESVYSASDVFLMCSRNDPYPNVFIDALAHGLPVIGFNQGQGSSELIEQFELGTMVPYQDMSATMTAIQRYRVDPHLRRAHGEEGMRVIEERFALEDYGATVLSQLENLHASVNKGGRSTPEIKSDPSHHDPTAAGR